MNSDYYNTGGWRMAMWELMTAYQVQKCLYMKPKWAPQTRIPDQWIHELVRSPVQTSRIPSFVVSRYIPPIDLFASGRKIYRKTIVWFYSRVQTPHPQKSIMHMSHVYRNYCSGRAICRIFSRSGKDTKNFLGEEKLFSLLLYFCWLEKSSGTALQAWAGAHSTHFVS